MSDKYCHFNTNDTSGLLCAAFVWCSILYASCVIIVVANDKEIAVYHVIFVLIFVFLSLWSHYCTMTGDPGIVPYNAHPISSIECNERTPSMNILLCGRCDAYKPPSSHHDRVTDRCISRMDHFCPWMNNAIGAKNQKNFFLFLIYTDIVSIYMYVLLALHMIDCKDFICLTGVSLNLVRVLIFVLVFSILFTSSMILNQIYGLTSGLGTIDRMKLKKNEPEDGIPVPFEHVFGAFGLSYFLPFDPVFADEEAVYHYCIKDGPYTGKV